MLTEKKSNPRKFRNWQIEDSYTSSARERNREFDA